MFSQYYNINNVLCTATMLSTDNVLDETWLDGQLLVSMLMYYCNIFIATYVQLDTFPKCMFLNRIHKTWTV